MRTRRYQATLAAALWLGAGVTACRAGDDGFWTSLDKPVDAADGGGARKPAPGDLDTTPTQSIAPDARTGAVGDAGGSAQGAPHLAVDAAKPSPPVAHPTKAAPIATATRVKVEGPDPEPDVAITPPKPLSNDPLDALTSPRPSPSGDKPQGAPAPDDDPDLAKPAQGTPATAGGADHADPAAPSAQTAQEPLAPLNAAIKASLDKRGGAEFKGPRAAARRKEHEALAFFYAAHGFAPIWSTDGRPVAAVEPVLARLAAAGEDALTLTEVPKTLVVTGSPAEIADSELALSAAVFSYARQATGSRVDPIGISPLIGLKRDLADPSETLEAVVAAGREAGNTLRNLNPIDPRYVALRDKLEALRKPHQASDAAIAAGPTLRVGMHDSRVPRLRARFDIAPSLEPDDDPTRYDDEVAAAVAKFQRASGLPPSGTLTRRTVAALSGPVHDARQEGTIIANMEMWRWMPRTLAANHIEVNVPDYLVRVYKDGAIDSQHRVVVGKQDTPTPLFTNAMKYLIVNPYWNVPQSIVKKEMLPKGGGSLNYLEGRGYSVSYKGGQAVVKQLPGDKNALGRIKFLFPNDYSVYLHDTPSKSLFAASKRAFSHGCVRVDQPFSFAESVLNDAAPADGGRHWSEEKLEDMIGDKERYINLSQPLPIVIEYFTASVEPESGQLKLREDIYGYAHAVAAALGQDSEPPAPEQRKPAPIVAERAPRRAAPARTARREDSDAPMARTAEAAAPSPIRSFFGGLFDPR